jgi:hypothetical protein
MASYVEGTVAVKGNKALSEELIQAWICGKSIKLDSGKVVAIPKAGFRASYAERAESAKLWATLKPAEKAEIQALVGPEIREWQASKAEDREILKVAKMGYGALGRKGR